MDNEHQKFLTFFCRFEKVWHGICNYIGVNIKNKTDMTQVKERQEHTLNWAQEDLEIIK